MRFEAHEMAANVFVAHNMPFYDLQTELQCACEPQQVLIEV